METPSDRDLLSANNPITRFSCNLTHHFSTKPTAQSQFVQ